MATSPNEPTGRPLSLLPSACAQSSMIGRPGATLCNSGMSHILPNIWTATRASSSFLFAIRSSLDKQNVAGSTSRNRTLQPADSIALKTIGQQNSGAPMRAPGRNRSALIAANMPTRPDRTGMQFGSSGKSIVAAVLARLAATNP